MATYRTTGCEIAAAVMVASDNDDAKRDEIRSYTTASAMAVLDISVARTLRRT